MRAIDKGREPQKLRQYRNQKGAKYDGANFTPVKERIREALLREQGALCAYCMQRITETTMKIEHWHCQTSYPNEQLVYKNLLGCCKGNEGESPRNQHCDTRKGDLDITLNPADPAHHTRLRIRYAGDGTIRSENRQFNNEINNVLNLNWSRLKSNRKSVVSAVMQVLSQRPGTRTKNEIRRLLAPWQRPNDQEELKEYCGVAIYYLEKRLARAR